MASLDYVAPDRLYAWALARDEGEPLMGPEVYAIYWYMRDSIEDEWFSYHFVRLTADAVAQLFGPEALQQTRMAGEHYGRIFEVLTAPPQGMIPLADYARSIGADIDVASQAARNGRVHDAVQVRVPGTPKPVWYVPQECGWRPGKRGRPARGEEE